MRPDVKTKALAREMRVMVNRPEVKASVRRVGKLKAFKTPTRSLRVKIREALVDVLDQSFKGKSHEQVFQAILPYIREAIDEHFAYTNLQPFLTEAAARKVGTPIRISWRVGERRHTFLASVKNSFVRRPFIVDRNGVPVPSTLVAVFT